MTAMATTNDIMMTPIGGSVRVDPWMTLIVAERTNTPEAFVTVLTSDGGPYSAGGWHTEPESLADGEWVYVERYSFGTRVFHGYIHPVSRKLTQTG